MRAVGKHKSKAARPHGGWCGFRPAGTGAGVRRIATSTRAATWDDRPDRQIGASPREARINSTVGRAGRCLARSEGQRCRNP
jgi:hypothetical protein